MKAKEEYKVGDKIKFLHGYPNRYLVATVSKRYNKGRYIMYLCRTRHFNICLRSEEMMPIKRRVIKNE